ncbi:hypothetical protein BH23ACT9_BH23ACT9_15580 [soil metagenome]
MRWMTQAPSQAEPVDVLRRIQEQLANTPRASRPAQHATLRYRVGMALAELPTGDRQENLSQAVRQYDHAADLFRAGRFPLEHARVQSARGAALRELGRSEAAATACRTAVRVMPDDAPGWERGAALNNLGLALSDLARHDEATDAMRQAVALFDAAGADVAPQRVMGHHNLGQVLAASGAHDQAADAYRAVLADVDAQSLPFQWALLHHALGVSLTALADPAAAVASFRRALQVFTRTRHPFQHALASNNLGLAWAQVGGPTGLRHAVVAFGDAVSVLDSRVHRPLWSQAYSNLEATETALAAAGHAATRATHLVTLLAELEEAERTDLVREQLTRLLALPDPRRGEALTELELAALQLPERDAVAVTATRLAVLLELPDAQLLVGLQSVMAARSHLDESALDDAEWVLDQAISGGMLAPQRIRVRDHLAALGHERR